MTAWVVRGGRDGEAERWNLSRGRATVGWNEIGDLSDCRSREDVRALVDAALPGDSPQRQANHTGQLWAFRDSIKKDDLIAMPLKTTPGYIQFGRVTGDYAYDQGQPDKNLRHWRPVTWEGEPVSKTVIGDDLVYTLNGIMTVFKPSRNNAAARLEQLARTGTDPGDPGGATPATTPEDPGSTDVTDPDTAPTIDAIRDRIRGHVAAEFREHELTQLVAEVLSVLGFHCEVSPPGPDGGVDIIAGTGPLGLDAPTVIVEVKSEPTPIDVKVVRGLHSAMVQHRADQALLVAWGGVTRPARKEFERDRTVFRVWDAEAFLDKVFETYDRLPAATRAKLPMRQVWVLDND